MKFCFLFFFSFFYLCYAFTYRIEGVVMETGTMTLKAENRWFMKLCV